MPKYFNIFLWSPPPPGTASALYHFRFAKSDEQKVKQILRNAGASFNFEKSQYDFESREQMLPIVEKLFNLEVRGDD